MKCRDPRRRPRQPPVGGDRDQAQADGRDRRPADPLAHHEALRRATATRTSSIALGYKGEYIKRYMVDYASLHGDLTVSTARRATCIATATATAAEPDDWTVRLVDTGQDTATGGRIKRLEPRIGRETFMLTWGDGVSNIDLDELLAFHQAHGKLATVTAVRPPARFGHLELDGRPGHRVLREAADSARAGSTAPSSCSSRRSSTTSTATRRSWSASRSSGSPRDGQLMAYRHDDFWQCMDTLRDKKLLEELWQDGSPLEDLEPRHARSRDRPQRLHRLLAGAAAARERATRSSASTTTSTRRARSARTSTDVAGAAQGRARRRSAADLEGFDAVIHLAAISNDPLGDLNPDATYDINHRAATRLATLAKEAGVQRFLFSSSCSLYGAAGDDFARRERRLQPGHARTASPSCWSSTTCASSPTTTSARPTCATRPPTASRRGCAATWSSTTSRRTRYARARCCMKSDGMPWRPLVHIEDISRAFVAILRRRASSSTTSRSTSAAPRRTTGSATSPRSSARSCRAARSRSPTAPRPDIRNYRVNCDKIAETLPEYQPQWTVRRRRRGALRRLPRQRRSSSRTSCRGASCGSSTSRSCRPRASSTTACAGAHWRPPLSSPVADAASAAAAV